MNRKLRKAIEKAEHKMLEARSSVDNISKHIKFEGFDDNDMPSLNIANDEEIILVHYGKEVHTSDIIRCMESKGYITPDDFI